MSMTSEHGRQGHDEKRDTLPPPATGVAAAPSSIASDDAIHYSGPRWDGSHLGDRTGENEGPEDVRIASELASANGIDNEGRGSDPTAGAGQDLSSGPATLGGATGGERALAGTSDANRSSSDHTPTYDDNRGRTPT